MSKRNQDNHNRFRSKTIAFRVSPEEDEQINIAVSLIQANCKVHRAVFDRLGEVLDELKRLEPSDDIDDELMDNISLILTVANGLYNPENHIESE